MAPKLKRTHTEQVAEPSRTETEQSEPVSINSGVLADNNSIHGSMGQGEEEPISMVVTNKVTE